MKAAERLLRYLLRNPDRAEALRDRLPEGYFLSENDRTMYRVLLQRGLSGQELDISALGENLPTGGGPAGQMAAAGRPAGDR